MPKVADHCPMDQVRNSGVTMTANDHHLYIEFVDHTCQLCNVLSVAQLPVCGDTILVHCFLQFFQPFLVGQCLQVFAFHALCACHGTLNDVEQGQMRLVLIDVPEAFCQ